MHAPNAIIPVPDHNLLVNRSPGRSMQLKIELKISPILCNGDKIISGRVDIWIADPKTFAIINKLNPRYHILRLYFCCRWCVVWWYTPFGVISLSTDKCSKCDFLWRVTPKDWIAEETTATEQPKTMAALLEPDINDFALYPTLPRFGEAVWGVGSRPGWDKE